MMKVRIQWDLLLALLILCEDIILFLSPRPAALGGPFFRTTQKFLVQTDQLLVDKLRILHWSVVTQTTM